MKIENGFSVHLPREILQIFFTSSEDRDKTTPQPMPDKAFQKIGIQFLN